MRRQRRIPTASTRRDGSMATALLTAASLIPAMAIGQPGIAGTLQIDLLASVSLAALALPATTGTAVSTSAIPAQPDLLGIDLFAQGLIFAAKLAWTPAVHERIL
ncbi:MAG: hypothetical protein AB8H80_22355 [Planctomycetota bacterium]